MPYQSDRPVKSARRTAPTTRASATRDARRVFNRLYPAAPWASMLVSVESTLTADRSTLAPQVRTVVIFHPELPSPASLALALYELPGLVDCHYDATGYITITRTA